MEITLDRNLIESLSHRGILAYLAATMADGTVATTAVLAGMVKCRPDSMREGLSELERVSNGALVRHNKNKWTCGSQLLGNVVQTLDSSKYQRLVDDLKRYWDYLNPDIPFAMGGRDGQVIQRFLKDHASWEAEQWRMALRNRIRSVVHLNAAPRSEPLYLWIGKLASYAGGMLDKYGHPAGDGGNSEKHERAIATQQANRAAAERVLNSFKG